MSEIEQHPTDKFRLLLIGASGQFGSKLARLLAAEDAIELVLAGRRRAPLYALQQSLEASGILVLDRNAITATTLLDAGINMVADLSGPYQEMQTGVVHAAIEAGVHYIDIADSRKFINAIAQFDADATSAACAIITGASSTPALSHAVIDDLTEEWQRIDSIEATISPSNSQEYGLSVIRGILGQVGKPVSLFTGGDWRNVSYWSQTSKRELPGVGTRYTSIVETPDNDLFVSRYKPTLSASFRASLELAVMHLSVSALSKIVNSGVLKSAASLAIPLQWMANKLSLFSKNYGGMLVNVTGRGSNGEPVSAEWSLSAQGEAGPHIPILACLIIIRKLAKDKQLIKGAHVCTGLVSLSEFNAEFEKLGIQTQKKLVNLSTPPFEIALGESFYKLPEITQLIHITAPSRLLSGEVNVEGARNPLTKMIAYIFRMPTNSKATPFQTSIELDDTGTENWARHFPLRCMRSRMGNPDPKNSTIDESFGLFRFTLQLDAHESGIDMHLLSGRFINIKLPSFFLPKINATERANADKHLFDVEVGLPLIGRLVHYSGWLEVKD